MIFIHGSIMCPLTQLSMYKGIVDDPSSDSKKSKKCYVWSESLTLFK